MYADDFALSTFPQRLTGDRGQARVKSQRVTTEIGQAVADRFEGVQAQLAIPLPLDQYPILVPVGQEIMAKLTQLVAKVIGPP